MKAKAFHILVYHDEQGRAPFASWLGRLNDPTRARVLMRLDIVERGSLGKTRSLGGGVQEMKIDYGPGYRLYFGRDGEAIVILLCGGDKRSQRRDIELAKQYWKDYQGTKK